MTNESIGAVGLRCDDEPAKPSEQDLVMEYLPVIRRIAGSLMRRLPTHMRLDDLEAAGIIGLLSATQMRDPERAEKFESYARRRIEGAMLDELRREDVLPKDARLLSKRIVAAMSQVEQRNGHMDEQAVAEELGVTVEQYRGMLERTVDVRLLSLESIIENASDHSRDLQHLAGEDKTALDAILEAESCARVAAALRRLPDKQRKVLALYYLEDLNMKEIAMTLNLTVARVCQLHSEGVHAVRAMLAKEEAEI